MHESETFICKAVKGEAIVNLCNVDESIAFYVKTVKFFNDDGLKETFPQKTTDGSGISRKKN